MSLLVHYRASCSRKKDPTKSIVQTLNPNSVFPCLVSILNHLSDNKPNILIIFKSFHIFQSKWYPCYCLCPSQLSRTAEASRAAKSCDWPPQMSATILQPTSCLSYDQLSSSKEAEVHLWGWTSTELTTTASAQCCRRPPRQCCRTACLPTRYRQSPPDT